MDFRARPPLGTLSAMQIRIVNVNIVGACGGLDVEQYARQGSAPGDRHSSGQLRPAGRTDRCAGQLDVGGCASRQSQRRSGSWRSGL